MGRAVAILVLALAVGGCGSSGIEGTLAWVNDPAVSPHALNGTARNTTSHSVTLSAKGMRLLDADGKKVAARFRLSKERLEKGGTAVVSATWKSGKPVRIDYGSGTLALPSG